MGTGGFKLGLGWLVVVLLLPGVAAPERALAQEVAADQVAAPGSDDPSATVQRPSSFADHPVWHVIVFYLFAGMTVVSAAGICLSRNIVRMAVWLFAALGSVAMLYFLLAAPFLGAIQLIVYVGGTLVLLIFGVMLTSNSPWARFETRRSELLIAAAVCAVLAVAMIGLLFGTDWPVAGQTEASSVAVLGKELLTTYLVPFEAASVLLLVVMVGAAYLARPEK
ncbi:MAG: NADH-quinone oxidoreductase subunit J family protein [Planctomycetota bacterium]